MNTVLHADGQILIAISECELQTIAYHLNLIARKCKMTTSSTKTKSMAMWGNHIHVVKIVIKDNIIEQVKDFKYLGYHIPEYKSDLEDIQRSKLSYMETFWKTNEQRKEIKNSQHYS